VVVDGAAASQLQGADYYRWVFANEPEWQEFRNMELRVVKGVKARRPTANRDTGNPKRRVRA
jgi:hypothetical protein